MSPPPHPAVEVYVFVLIGSRFIPPPDPLEKILEIFTMKKNAEFC